MYPQLDLGQSYRIQMEQLEKRFSSEINGIEKHRENKHALIKEILKIYAKDWNYEKRGNGQLLPAYYAMKHDFDLAWLLALCLNIRWRSTNMREIDIARIEFETPEQNSTKPFKVVLHTLDEIKKNNYADASPFSVDEPAYNELIYDVNTKNEINNLKEPYDTSPFARYNDLREYKHFHMSYCSMNELLVVLPLALRQERYKDVAEMLFRLRYILSAGEPPKHITEGPRHRHYAAWMNMYERWFQARFAEEPSQRKSLARQALFWYVETGLRSAGTTFIREFIAFTDFCEIVGEFELMDEDQDEFLRHFKKWTMHASISHYTKMQANPIQPIPFSERNLPTYDDIRALYEQMFCNNKMKAIR